tara:strand:- start:776 stop:1075 length:300 start_codon:yes stop_codon:yes gene_type:complete
MEILKILNRKKLTLISMLLFIYVIMNLIDGERGLISFYEKQKIKKELIAEKTILKNELSYVEKKNSLLLDTVDLDYLETLYRKKFMVGKSNEKIYMDKL